MTASSGQSAGQSHETSDRDLPTSSCKGSHLGLPGYLDHGRWQYRQDTFLGCGATILPAWPETCSAMGTPAPDRGGNG